MSLARVRRLERYCSWPRGISKAIMGELTAADFRRQTPQPEVVTLDLTPLSSTTEPTMGEEAAQALDQDPDINLPATIDYDVPEPIKIPPALRPFVPTAEFRPAKLTSRTELMAQLTTNLPRNDIGLPLTLYRPDLLDYTLFNRVEEIQESIDALQEHLDAARVHLDYYEGYPALPDGNPVWGIFFDWESTADHDLFLRYLELPGARQLSFLVTTHTPLQRVQELFHANYWSIRAQASDQFAVIHHQRLRE